MSDILTDAEFVAVRNCLGVDVESLPDAVIASFPFLIWTETRVKAMVDAWSGDTQFAEIQTAAGADWEYVKAGTIFLLAAMLTNYVRMKEADTVRIGDYSETRMHLSWEKRETELQDMARRSFARVSTRAFTRHVIFSVSGPTSSGYAVAGDIEEWYERLQPRLLDYIEEGGTEDDEFASTT